MDNDLLEEIIQKKVAARTKNLSSELGQLKKQMASLNKGKGNVTPTTKKDRRGQPAKTPGASIIKKKSTRATKDKTTAQKAVVAVKGTTQRRKEKKTKPDEKKKRKQKKKKRI